MRAPHLDGPEVKGWCPGAYRPMASGDGLVVRVRPWMGELSAQQVVALCDIADRFGTDMLELTSRANLQIRGVSDHDHEGVIAALLAANLLDIDPAMEGRRNLVMTPDWTQGDETYGLAKDLMAELQQLPDLPAKFGYAIDTAAAPWLANAPADIRIERDINNGLILVADGADGGLPVTTQSATEAVGALVAWFIETGGRASGRMARHLRDTPLPEDWSKVPRRRGQRPSTTTLGALLGVPFGQVETQALRALISGSTMNTLRILPDRTLLAMDTSHTARKGFCAPDDPMLNVHACTGAPGCPQALGPTRSIARTLAEALPKGETLHVSGCTKGCAHPRAADRTYVATHTGFDLVSGGAPWDAPVARNIPADALSATMTPLG